MSHPPHSRQRCHAITLAYHGKVTISVTKVIRMVTIGANLVPIWWKIGEKNEGQAFCLPLAYGWFLRGESGTLDELVAYPPLSDDPSWVGGIVAQLLAKAIDVLLDKAAIFSIFWPPYLL